MKKAYQFLLASAMTVLSMPVVYATNDYTVGTQVIYTADNEANENWTITVPAKLNPGKSGDVTLEGYWASNTQITITAQQNVELTNNINSADTKTLTVFFNGISEYGNNTESQKFVEPVSVSDIDNALFGTWNGHFYYNVESHTVGVVEQLQNQYRFTYYSTLNDAINDVNNDIIGENADSEKDNAVAGIYTDEKGVVSVVLLQDRTLDATIKPTRDMTINLGGHVLTSVTGSAITINSGNIYIDATIPGSKINVDVPSGKNARAIAIAKTASATIDGGIIDNKGVNTTTPAILCLGTFNANGTTIISKSDTARTDGVSCSEGSTVTLNNCEIYAHSAEGKAYAVYVSKNCNVVINNSTAIGYANYIHDGSSYTSCSMGIYQSANSTLKLNNCHVNGNIAGIQTYGTLYVDGGTYEGYGHGGFYFVGTSATSYIKNATIRECGMSDNYETNNGTNHTGLYVGGNSGNSIYMNNCVIESTGHAIVLRSTSGENNNTLYISNSTINTETGIRIDDISHKLYIGQGNNFTKDNTTLPAAVIETNDTYYYNG